MENKIVINDDQRRVAFDDKLQKIIGEQSNQMLSLVDISNAHNDENEILRSKIQTLEDDNVKLQSDEKYLREIFNLQSLLFTLLILLLIWLFYCDY